MPTAAQQRQRQRRRHRHRHRQCLARAAAAAAVAWATAAVLPRRVAAAAEEVGLMKERVLQLKSAIANERLKPLGSRLFQVEEQSLVAVAIVRAAVLRDGCLARIADAFVGVVGNTSLVPG